MAVCVNESEIELPRRMDASTCGAAAMNAALSVAVNASRIAFTMDIRVSSISRSAMHSRFMASARRHGPRTGTRNTYRWSRG